MAKITDDDQRLVALKAHEFNVEATFNTAKLQADFGRWLIATVTAIQLGAIYFVGSVADAPLSAKIPAIWAFVVGLALILLSGLVTWLNWSFLAWTYRGWCDANMLVNTGNWPKPYKGRGIAITYWLSLIFGIASAICLLVGAALFTIGLPTPSAG